MAKQEKLTHVPSSTEDRKDLKNKIDRLVDIKIQQESLAEDKKDLMDSLTGSENKGGMNYCSKKINTWVKYAYDLKYGGKEKVALIQFEEESLAETEIITGLKAAIEAVADRHEPLLITSKAAEVVMLSREDYNSMVETMYLLRSTKNSQRLIESIAQLNGGSLIEEDLTNYEFEEEKEN